MAIDYQMLMPTYYDSGWTVGQMTNYFKNKVQPEQPPVVDPPTPVELKNIVKKIADAYYVDGIGKSNGVIGISIEVGASVEFVQQCLDELDAGYAAWQAEQ